MSTQPITPCPLKDAKGRIRVRVTRASPSKKKKRTGKQVGNLKLKLRLSGSTNVIATSTSKSGDKWAVFDKKIDPTLQYEVDLIVSSAIADTERTIVFGPPAKGSGPFAGYYRTADVEFEVAVYEYRIALELGDVDSIFTDAANTRAGRMARLQVLGLLPRPLGHAEADDCFDYVWGTYMKRLVAGSEDPVALGLIDDNAIDQAIAGWLPQFLVENGAFPAPAAFAKIRAPGDYRVFHRDFDEMYFKEPQFSQFRGVRYNVEKAFRDANPALGKIPVVVKLERRHQNSTDPWVGAPNKKVYLQLAAPDQLPPYTAPGSAKDVIGASSWVDGVTHAPVRDTAGKELKSSRKAKNGGPGPVGYLRRHVTERKGDPNFAKPNKHDPQKANVWCEIGGKRKTVDDMRDVSTAGTSANVFSLADLGQFRAKGPFPAAAASPDLKAHPFSIELKTNNAGKAGVIFAPSLIGGDRYRLRAYYGHSSKAPHTHISSGTMVRWRTMRISRSLSVKPPAAKDGLDPAIKAELQAYYGECDHKKLRYCGDCLLREGAVVDMDLSGYLTRELSKSYCELLVDKTAVQPAHKVIDQACLTRAITALQTEQSNGDQQGGIVDYNEPAILNAGSVVGTLKGKGSIIPKNVKVIVMLSGTTGVLLIDDGAGAFTGTGKQLTVGVVFEGNGTIDYATGAYNITFVQGVPAAAEVKIAYKLKVAVDLSSLFYWSDKSPFLLNMHTPQAYNSLIDPTQFPKIPVETEVNGADIGTGDGTVVNFEYQLPASYSSYTVLLGGAPAPASINITLDKTTNKLKIFKVEAVTQEVDYDSGGSTTGSKAMILPMDPAPDSIMVGVSGTSQTGVETNIVIIRTNGNVMINGGPNGMTATWAPTTRTVTVNFPVEGADRYSKLTLGYKKPVPLDGQAKLTINYKSNEIFDNTTPKPVKGGIGIPSGSLDRHLAKMINFYLMIKLIRAIDNDNDGYTPGLIGLQAPLRDTWSSVYDPDGLHQGKGLCNGFFVFYGNRWRNAPQDDVNTFNQISLHEMSHCLYLNHFPSGSPFGGGSRADLHDMYDSCMMGYGKNEEDLCGKCVAAFMGVNTGDQRLGTWTGKSQIGTDSLIPSLQDETDDPKKKQHVEPPTLADPDPVTDGDNMNSLLLNCAVGKQVWDLAVAANGGVEPTVIAAGPTGTGAVEIITGDISYPTVARVEFANDKEKNDLIALGGELKTAVGGGFVQFIGDWVGVQILIMELGNFTKRYDFFDLDYRMQKGDVGLEAYVEGTERIEYDGGVTYVIRAYNSCKNMWGAKVCQKFSAMKDDQSGPLDWAEYYDHLPATHKDKYYGYWHQFGQAPFYKKKCARLRALSDDRVAKVLDIVKNTFGSADSWKIPTTAMNLFGHDDACWKLLNIMYGLDPDWDIDPPNRVLDWTKAKLALESKDTAPLVRVQHINTLAQNSPPDLT